MNHLPSHSQAVGLLIAFAGIALITWLYQNSGQRLGGKISLIKAAWLAYAIVLWFGVPLVLWNNALAFKWLSISMLVRAAIELPLCLKGKWRASYGITHNLIHTAITLSFLSQIPAWGTLTLIALATETLFVTWFISATAGPREGIFFVPAGKEYQTINRRTSILFLPQATAFTALLVSALFQ